MYEILITNSVQKDIRRLDEPLQHELHDNFFPEIKQDPYQGEQLRGALKGVRSYHLTFQSTQYRIAYEILEKKKAVLIVMVAKRGDFYEALTRRLGL